MTTSGVNPGNSPLNVLTVLGQQQPRDGSGKNPDLDFAGLLSRLSASVDAGHDAKADPSQSFVAKVAIGATPPAQRNGDSDPSVAPIAPQRILDQPADQADRAGSEDMAVVIADVSTDDEKVEQAASSEAETAMSTDAASSGVGRAIPQPEEIQALLSSVMRVALPDADGKHSPISAKTSAQAAVLAQGTRAKPIGEHGGLAAEVVGKAQGADTQLPVDTAWQELVQVSLDHLADSMAPRGKDNSTASAPAADLKLAVLQTETHHAPVLHGGPMAQVADGIRSELGDAGETALTWSPSASATAKPHADAPVKVLLIQLQPADLGTVTVRMSLKDDALNLHIEASQQDTAQRLQQDQDSLSNVLRSAGYLIDGVAIRAADPDRSLVLPSQTSASLSQSSYQQAAGDAPSEGGASQGRGHQEHNARGQARQDTPADAGGQRQASARGLFV